MLGKGFFDVFQKRNFYSLMYAFVILKKNIIYLFITKKNLFLQVYEQRDKFRYVIKKGVQGKNKVIRDLSLCVIKKLDSYDILKAEIKGEEFHILIDIVYIPVN